MILHMYILNTKTNIKSILNLSIVFPKTRHSLSRVMNQAIIVVKPPVYKACIQAVISAKTSGEIVSSICAYSFGDPVTARWNR